MRKTRAGIAATAAIGLGLCWPSGAVADQAAAASQVVCIIVGPEQPPYCPVNDTLDLVEGLPNFAEQTADPVVRPQREAVEGVVETGSDAGVSGANTAANTADRTAGGGGCGNRCLPKEGYTFNRYYNCGLIYGRHVHRCWFPGYLGRPDGHAHTWSWGSADYDGGGVVDVGVQGFLAGSDDSYGAVGQNLARVCFMRECEDQDQVTSHMSVYHFNEPSNTRHTIYGHAMA